MMVWGIHSEDFYGEITAVFEKHLIPEFKMDSMYSNIAVMIEFIVE